MKRLISCLFFLAALAAAAQPAFADKISRWIIVAILFENNEVSNSRLFGGFAAEADCRKAQESLAKDAAAASVDVWAECVEVVRDKTYGDPKTKKKS